MYLAIERPIITDGMKTDQGPRDFVQVSLQETFLSNCANQERLSAMQNPTTIHIVLLPIAALRYVYLAMITVEIIADGMKNDRGPGILYKYRCSKGFEQSSQSRETIAHPIPPDNDPYHVAIHCSTALRVPCA